MKKIVKEIILGVVILGSLLILWNLIALYLIHTKTMTYISGDAFTFIVPQDKTRIYCNGSPITTLNTASISGMNIGDDSYKVFLIDKSVQTYVCE